VKRMREMRLVGLIVCLAESVAAGAAANEQWAIAGDSFVIGSHWYPRNTVRRQGTKNADQGTAFASTGDVTKSCLRQFYRCEANL
jgi:hypothetical protein